MPRVHPASRGDNCIVNQTHPEMATSRGELGPGLRRTRLRVKHIMPLAYSDALSTKDMNSITCTDYAESEPRDWHLAHVHP